MGNPTIENVTKVTSIRQWKKGTTLIVGDSMLTGIEEKRISENGSVNVRVFRSATTKDMYYYLKPLLKKNPEIILHIGTNNWVNETSRDVLKGILSLKNLLKHCVHHATQPAITCSKLTIETLEQGVKYVQS